MRAKNEKPLNYDRWATKTRSKRRAGRGHEPSIIKAVDAGFHYFWSRRPTVSVSWRKEAQS